MWVSWLLYEFPEEELDKNFYFYGEINLSLYSIYSSSIEKKIFRQICLENYIQNVNTKNEFQNT